jgi:hypothetical protein
MAEKKCCSGMESALSESDERGFSVVIENDMYKITFNVVEPTKQDAFFAVMSDKLVREKLIQQNIKNSSLGGKIGLKYCPWCGTKLT